MRNSTSPIRIVLLSLALLVLTACSRPVAVHHQGPTSLPAQVRSYAILQHPVATEPALVSYAHQLVRTEMARKGYVEAPRASADVLVSVKTLARHQEAGETTSTEEMLLLGPTLAPDTSSDSSKLVLVLLEEAKTDRVLWVGWSAGEYPEHEVTQKMRESLAEIFTRLPRRG